MAVIRYVPLRQDALRNEKEEIKGYSYNINFR